MRNFTLRCGGTCVSQINSRFKAVVMYYSRKTARRSYARELIRQTNHVARGAYLIAVNDIPRNVED